ncbi:MAG: hypothetical protein BalsKO_15560 [Balneolaceae bacterium]
MGCKTWEQKARINPYMLIITAMWINPNDSEHLLLGNDGGLYESHDGGENLSIINTIAVWSILYGKR